MGTNTGTIMTLANSIIGVSVLAMPFCFKQCGIILSVVMLFASSLLSRLACHFLLKSAVMARRRTFEFLAFHTFGWTGKFAVEVFIIGFLMGTCIAFFVVMGDLGPAIVAKIVGTSNTEALRPSVLIGLAVFVVLPLGMLKNVDSLSSISIATIGFYICLVFKVIGESLPHLLAGDWYEHVHLWRPAGILQCIPIFSMALFCQTQLFEIYESMHNASLDRMNFVIRAACNICTGVYICVGFFGYIAFCTQQFTGNVMMSFSPSVGSEIIKLGFVLSVAVSFPLVIFPCRASLYSLLFRRITVPHHEGIASHIPEARFKCLTVVIISVALVIGLLIPNIELVLGLVGSTIGVLICVMFPAAAFICMSTKSSNDRLLAQILLFVGALILVLGTYATLNSVNENGVGPDVPTKGFDASINIINDKPLVEKIDNSLADIPPKLEHKEESIVVFAKKEQKETTQEVKLDVKQKEKFMDLNKADKRQEPPVPVEPIGDAVQVPSIASIVNEKKLDIEAQITMKENNEIRHKEEEKEKNMIEIKEKEVKNNEQIHEDAINKEEEELAEAEKRAEAVEDSKKEEILRKLEKHEEQQMKILKKQEEILVALQEHQERDLMKVQKHNVDVKPQNEDLSTKQELKQDYVVMKKQQFKNSDLLEKDNQNNLLKQQPDYVVMKKQKENSDKNVDKNNNIVQLNDKEVHVLEVNQQKLENQILKQEDRINIKQNENIIPEQNKNINLVGNDSIVHVQKGNEIYMLPKIEKIVEPQQQGINIVDKLISEPIKKKQDLLQQIANGELKPAVLVPAKEIVSVQKSDKKIDNFVGGDHNAAGLKESFHVAGPKLDNKPGKEGPIHPHHLEHLSQPLPLQMKKSSVPVSKVIEEKPEDSMNEINAMRREILQEPAANTPISLIEANDKNDPVRPVSQHSQIKQDIHNREKRDIEEEPEKKLSILVKSKEMSNKSYKVTNENNLVPNSQNCHLSEKREKGNDGNTAYEKQSLILNSTENKDKFEMLENVQSQIPFQAALNQKLDGRSENNEKIAKSLENKVLQNSSALAKESTEEHTVNDAFNSEKSKIDTTIIKASKHLSYPHLKSNNADLPVLKQNILPPDTKPMKRDLKSIYVQEEKSPSNRSEN